MTITMLDSIEAQRAVLAAPPAQRDAVLRERIIDPLRGMMFGPISQDASDQATLNAARMLAPGLLTADPAKARVALDDLEQAHALDQARNALERAVQTFQAEGRSPLVEQVTCGVHLGDPTDDYFMNFSKGYTGFGGIPGYVLLLWPNAYTLPRIAPALAHEFHHNVRLSYAPWQMDISVGEYIVLEGLAESFAGALYGPEAIGPWVTSLDAAEIAYAKNVIGAALDVRGFNDVRGYIFGDTMADRMGYARRGLPFCAGYPIGYQIVQAYVQRTGRTIVDATFTPAEEIIAESAYFAP